MKQVILKLTINIADADQDLTKEQIEALAIQDAEAFFPGVMGDGEVLVNDVKAEVMQ